MAPFQILLGLMVLCIIFYGLIVTIDNTNGDTSFNSPQSILLTNPIDISSNKSFNSTHKNLTFAQTTTNQPSTNHNKFITTHPSLINNTNPNNSTLYIPPWHRIYSNHLWDKSLLHSKHNIKSTEMFQICNKTYWNALERTIYYSYIDNTTFVITGDIEDMWIRDSTEQIWPYFQLINQYKYIQYMIRGVILKQAQFILADVYTNAFRKEPYCYDQKLQILIKTSIVATRDDEIDSGAYFIKLLYEYYYQTTDLSIFFEHENIVKLAIIELLQMWQIEQYHDTLSPYKTVTHGIKLNLPNASYTGMIWTSHRPSDDLCKYPYHIADNFFVYEILNLVQYFASNIWYNSTMHDIVLQLQKQIYNGIHAFGVTNVDGFEDIYCYEVDGFGECNLMDDANIPSLLSIPMITNAYNKTIYGNTRKWLLSEANPYYYVSKNGNVKGIGSPHTPSNYIWPIALITQGFTTSDVSEKYELLEMLVRNTGGTGLMHESFDVNKDIKFTRKFFSWANSYFSLYGNCGKQFMEMDNESRNLYVKSRIKEKERSDMYIGSLSSIREVTGNDIQNKNPNFIQWLKVCEARGNNVHIDKARNIYEKRVFNRDFLGKHKGKK